MHFRLQRRVVARAPLGQKPVEADRINDRAGENMRAGLGALLDDDDGEIRRNLLQANRRGEAGRARADHDHVIFHRFAWRQLRIFSHFQSLLPFLGGILAFLPPPRQKEFRLREELCWRRPRGEVRRAAGKVHNPAMLDPLYAPAA